MGAGLRKGISGNVAKAILNRRHCREGAEIAESSFCIVRKRPFGVLERVIARVNSQHCGVTNLDGYLDFGAQNGVLDVSEIFELCAPDWVEKSRLRPYCTKC